MREALKFWVALAGALATAVITVVGSDTTVGKCAAIVSLAVTAMAVYITPNTPASDDA